MLDFRLHIASAGQGFASAIAEPLHAQIIRRAAIAINHGSDPITCFEIAAQASEI